MKRIAILLTIIIFSLLAFNLGCKEQPIPKGKSPRDISKDINNEKKTTLSFDKEAATTDPFNDDNGPFYHKVYKAISKDGLTFVRDERIVLDTASVPDVVKTNDGTLYLYAVDGSKRSNTDIMVAISKDSGKTFKQGSISILNIPKNTPLADPQAILTKDGKIRLFYVVFPKKQPPLDENGRPIPTGDKIKINSALSDDGINFEEEVGSRYETTDIVTDPDIIKIGNKWFMYLAKGEELIAASSSDGNKFELEKTVRNRGSISKTVEIEEGKYRQFFCGDGISSATTTDGLNWENDIGVRLRMKPNEILCDPSPVKVDSEWLLFFKVAPIPKNSPKPK